MSQLSRLENLLADGAVWRMRDLAEQGVTAATVARALAAGWLLRLSRGTYQRSDAAPSADLELAIAAARAPQSVVCCFSAAALHGLGDVTPPEAWIALPNHVRPPKLEWPPVRWVFWRAAAAFEVGVEERVICGVTVRITDRVRTTLDMLRMMRTVGEDRAFDTLRDYLEAGGLIAPLHAMADTFRVGKTVAPYLKAFAHLGRWQWGSSG